MPPNEPPRPRQPSHSDGDRPSLELDAVVGAAKGYAASQDHVRPELARKGTLTGLQAVRPTAPKATLSGLPAPPPLPLEHAVTRPAPPQLPFRKTMRVDSPPGLLAAARRSDPPAASNPPPTSVRVPADETVPSERQADREALLLQALAAERTKSAKLERDARAAAEARVQSFPPPVQPQRSQSPVPSSERESKPPSRGDWAKLRFKIATAIVAALVVVIGALAYWGVAAINAKAEAIKAAQEAKQKADGREEQWRSWASVVIWIEDCRDGRDVRSGEMLLPDLNKQGSARKLEPWQNPCSPKLPPPP